MDEIPGGVLFFLFGVFWLLTNAILAIIMEHQDKRKNNG